MRRLVSEAIENAPLYPPGKPLDEIKRTYGIDNLVKLNANENNLGPSPAAIRAIADALTEVHRYPDNSAYYLKRALAAKHDLMPKQIILGNGSNELVQFICMAFLQPGDEVITARPTFVLYRIMAGLMGGRVREISLRGGVYDLEGIAAAVSPETRLIFLTNPNNPTGTVFDAGAFDEFMTRLPEEVIVVVDEAYREYADDDVLPDVLAWVRRGHNLIALRTFSKAYGLAGLRIGYGFAPEVLIGHMDKVREPFNANSLAQVAACAALKDHEHLERTRTGNREGRIHLYEGLTRLGIDYVPSQANFVLIKPGPGAGELAEELLHAGIMVRTMAGFGVEDHLRVTVGLPEDNRRFLEALERIMAVRRGGGA